MLIDNHCTSPDDFAMNKELLMSQDFGITDAKVEAALRNIISDYISVGLIEKYNETQVEEVLNLVWNPVLKNNYKK